MLFRSTFSDFAFLALCTNLRPSFLAYQIEANIAMPTEGIRVKLLHNQLPSSARRCGAGGVGLELSLAGCCFLRASHAGELRPRAGGGREGAGGRQSGPASPQVPSHPARGRSARGGRAGAAFPAGAHAHPGG